MPQQYTYPGVYVQEIPSGLHTITGVSTSIAAFIDFFKQGPMNQAVQLTSLGDYNRIFGGLDDRSEASYAINQFFLNGGTQAYVVRTAQNAAKAQVILKADVTNAGAEILQVSALNEGVWGNTLRVDVDSNTPDPTRQFNFYVTRYSSTANNAQPLVTETYLNLTMDVNDARYAVNVVNQESKLVHLDRSATNPSNSTTPPCATGLRSDDLASLVPADFTALSGGKIKIQMGSSQQKEITINYFGDTVTDLVGLRKYLEIAIRSADPTTASGSFTGATVDLITLIEGGTAKKYFRILSGKKSDTYNPNEVVVCDDGTSNNAMPKLKLKTPSAIKDNIQEYVLGTAATVKAQKLVTGGVGSDGTKPDVAELIGQRAVEPYTGMYALEYADLFNILCIPRAADLAATNMAVVVSKALDYCQEKRAFMIIDIPKTLTDVQKMKDWMSANDNLRHKNAATYFPRLQQPDPLDEYRPRDVGVSGTMAGMFARTDSDRGVWKAPAGTEAVLRGITDLGAELTDGTNGILNPLAINCFRIFPIYGMVSWGARTLVGSDQAGSEWKYIPVRRLALFLEETLFRGTKWVVFEPNDEPLWAKIRMNIYAFMLSLFNQGAFQGTTPDKAFYIKCDSSTTTQDDRNHGVVNIEVGFAPLKPAEFVVIKLQQIVQKD